MKMMSRTKMTSTIGVTLISAMTGRRRCRLPATAAVSPFIAICVPLSPFVDLPRQDRGEFVGEPLQALSLFIHVRDELVIENRRRYGSDEADCGRKQGLGDTGGNDGQRGRLLARNAPKPRHDAPNSSEHAHKSASPPAPPHPPHIPPHPTTFPP